MMTGDVMVAVALNVVSFFAVLYNIPRSEVVEERRKEMHFPV